MSDRRLPVRPNLQQLKHQAKDLLRELRRENPRAKLADAQLALARSYEAPSWPRLVQACELVDAIWRDDLDAVRKLVDANPRLIRENALIRESNWGPPLSYAANLGRDRIIRFLHERGATDLEHALDRAALQGQTETARMLHQWLGAPRPNAELLEGPAYTLSATGTALLFELGASAENAPVHVVLETDSRKPEAKHQILELYARHGRELPDTPTIALHRGRIDLLEEHLRRDPNLLQRTFKHEEIYPPELGCRDEVLATHGTPLGGATLLHIAVDYDELAIARWLLDRGMDVNAKAAIDDDGFGGHTALFSAVVSQAHYWKPEDTAITRLLLDRGADPNVRASLRKQMHPGYGKDTLHEYRDVTPLEWGERFHFPKLVSRAAMRLIAERTAADPDR